MLITLGTLLYTIKKNSIATHKVTNLFACLIIGIMLGGLSSFLGIEEDLLTL